jgi:hypothetical protein
MSPFVPPLAAIPMEELIKLAVIFLIFIVPAIARLLAKGRQLQGPAAGKPRPDRPVPTDVSKQIEEFLRRRTTPQEPPKPPPPARRPPPPPVQAEVVGERPVGGQVGQHVAQYLDEEQFQRRESQLGKEVAQADRQIDQHLQQVFSHPVSKLEAVPGETAGPPTAAGPSGAEETSEASADVAAGLFNLLSTPDSLRQAILLNEILQRPEERWE